MRAVAAALALTLIACEGRSPTEPRSAPSPTPVLMAVVVGRVQDADSGALVPASIAFSRDQAPGATLTVQAPTGEFYAYMPPSTWHVSAIAAGYQPAIIELVVRSDSPQTTVTIGVRR